jgi:tetratricopeptide (TPR) repeat protein
LNAEQQIDALEEAGRYDDAVEALKKLSAATGEDVRWHVAWMHTRARNTDAAAAIWQELRAERDADPGVPYLQAAALLEDERDKEALPLLAEALELGMQVASDETLMRKVADERLAALTRAGLPPEEIDHRARELLARHAPATPWFNAVEFSAAKERWGAAFTHPASEHGGYAAELDRMLRKSTAGVTGRNPVLVPITVSEAEEFAAAEGWQAAWPVTHDQVAAAAVRDDPSRGSVWPPGRNEPCWCGSSVKYKRCCGR